MFCCRFRSHHYWLGAAVATAVLSCALWFVVYMQTLLRQAKYQNDGGLIGPVLLIATGAAVLFLVAWRRPLRRLLHMRHPRSRAWPPP